MKHSKIFAVLAVSGVLGFAAGVASCGSGTSPGCSPANCTGCCNGSFCAAGNVDMACGIHGVACQACSAD